MTNMWEISVKYGTEEKAIDAFLDRKMTEEEEQVFAEYVRIAMFQRRVFERLASDKK